MAGVARIWLEQAVIGPRGVANGWPWVANGGEQDSLRGGPHLSPSPVPPAEPRGDPRPVRPPEVARVAKERRC